MKNDQDQEQELVTKGFLKKELKRELLNQKNEICFELRSEMDTKFGAFYESLRDWKNEILNGQDKLIRRFDRFEQAG